MSKLITKFKFWAKSNNIMDRYPNYYKLFTKWTEKEYGLDNIKRAFNILQKSPNISYLSKNPLQYKCPVTLVSDLSKIDMKIRFISISHFKEIFSKLTKEEKKEFLFIDDYHIQSMKKYQELKDFTDHYGYKLTSIKTKVKAFVKKIKSRTDCELIHNKNNVVIFRCLKRSSIVAFGPDCWCIKNEDEWDDYVGSKGKKQQFIIYDFNSLSHTEDHILGVTIKNKKIKWIYNMDNEEVFDIESGYKFDSDVVTIEEMELLLPIIKFQTKRLKQLKQIKNYLKSLSFSQYSQLTLPTS